MEEPSTDEKSTALTTFAADLPKAPPAGEDSATGTALTATTGATPPDATEEEDETTTTASPQPSDKPADPTDKPTDATDPAKDGTTPGAPSKEDTTTADATSVNTKGTGHPATSKPDTEGGQDVSKAKNTTTFGGRHHTDDTASKPTHAFGVSAPAAGGRHRADDKSTSNAGTSSASSSETDSK